MKSKQCKFSLPSHTLDGSSHSFLSVCPKSVRPVAPINFSARVTPRTRVRCSLCNGLLKASTTHRYLLMGKPLHEKLPNFNVTYGECCERYLRGNYDQNKLHMICPKCSQDLQRIYSLHHDAEQLIEKIRHTCQKTKRLNHNRPLRSILPRLLENSSSSSPLSSTVTDDNIMAISVKEELDLDEETTEMKTNPDQTIVPISETVSTNMPFDLSKSQYRSDDLRNGKRVMSSKVTHATNGKVREFAEISNDDH